LQVLWVVLRWCLILHLVDVLGRRYGRSTVIGVRSSWRRGGTVLRRRMHGVRRRFFFRLFLDRH
jgi:hypothetical protein